MGIADIAERLGMSRSTTHRYVTTLVALGYLVQGAKRKYRLGLRVTDLGMSALNATGLREHAHADLVGAVAAERATRRASPCSKAMRSSTSIAYRGFAAGSEWPAPTWNQDRGCPTYCTALGKVLLAYLPEHERQRGCCR